MCEPHIKKCNFRIAQIGSPGASYILATLVNFTVSPITPHPPLLFDLRHPCPNTFNRTVEFKRINYFSNLYMNFKLLSISDCVIHESNC